MRGERGLFELNGLVRTDKNVIPFHFGKTAQKGSASAGKSKSVRFERRGEALQACWQGWVPRSVGRVGLNEYDEKKVRKARH